MKTTNDKAHYNKRFALGNTVATTLCLIISLLALPAYAVTNELVGSAESHSIEKYDSSGNWIKTFASTGPYYTVGFAASPITGDVFVSTFTSTILRYTKTGASFGPNGSYWNTFNMSAQVGSNPPQALLFDSKGDLFLATNYGESDAGYTVEIFEYSAKELVKETPAPAGPPILTTVTQGGQLAWDAYGDLCIASWYSETVQCYNASTGALVYDYSSEFQNAGIEPVGLAFNSDNLLTVSNLFSGQVLTETAPRTGPFNLMATGTVQPSDVGFLAVDNSGNLYLPEWHNVGARYESCSFYQCVDYDTSSDIVYEINPGSGVITNFISNHLWGPYQMIFVPF